MKKLLFAILILVSAVSAQAQTTQTKNPEKVTLTTTTVTEIVLARHKTIPHGNVDIWFIATAGNTGSITINGLGSDMTTGVYTLEEDKFIIITVNSSFYAKASNANDSFSFGVMSKN